MSEIQSLEQGFNLGHYNLQTKTTQPLEHFNTRRRLGSSQHL